MKLMDRIEKYKADGGEAAGFMVEFADAKYDEETATPFHVDFQVWFEVAPGVVRLSTGGAVEGVHGQKLDLLVSVDLEETWELGAVPRQVREPRLHTSRDGTDQADDDVERTLPPGGFPGVAAGERDGDDDKRRRSSRAARVPHAPRQPPAR